MEQIKKVGIWVRVSTEMQGDSPLHHEKRARAYAESKGWEVVRMYKLEAVSGKSIMGHFEAVKMLNDIKEGHITGLIFSKLARLARNTKELLEFADLFKENDADLISLEESIDTSSPAGRLFYTMIAAMAQWEREEISSRVSASIPIRAKLGKLIGGRVPYGYSWDGKEVTINPTEAPVRKLMYELYLKLKRKKAVAKELNEMGYRTRAGDLFSDTSIERLVRDTTAKGERRANFTTMKGKTMVRKPESEWVISPCPAIVSEELWNECNRLMDAQRAKKQRVGPRTVHLLAGFVVCESCSKKMYVFHEHSHNYVCRGCRNRISATDLDAIYHSQLKSFLLTDVDLHSFVNKSDSHIKEKEHLLSVVRNEAEQLRKKLDDFLELRVNGELTKERFALHYRPLEEQLGQLELQMPELEADIDFMKIQLMSSDTVLRDAKELYSRWETLPFEQKRTIVETITKQITVGKEDITVSLSHIPARSGQKPGKKQPNYCASISRPFGPLNSQCR